MTIAELLDVRDVRLLSPVKSKKRLFQEISDIASASTGVAPADMLEALLEREGLGPTGVGHGIALPHARVAGVERVVGLFARLEKPIEFDAVDRKPVDLVFALFAPTGAGVDHLKALALVSRTMRDPSTCEKLRANSDPATLHAVLTAAKESQAA
ncbi:MAG: PTS sugar transporter subunit IIA [Pseudomonadota bacterium]